MNARNMMKLYHILPAVAAVAGVAALIRAAAEWRALHLLGVRRIVELQRELAEARRSAVAWQGLAAEALKKAATLVNEAEDERDQPREEMAVEAGDDEGPIACPECGNDSRPWSAWEMIHG